MLKKRIEDLGPEHEVEKIRLHVEYYRARWTIVSIVVPLLAAFTTILVSTILEARRARADFELKAMELVVTAESPPEGVNKAAVLQELFPERLPSNFAERVEKVRKLYNLQGDSRKE